MPPGTGGLDDAGQLTDYGQGLDSGVTLHPHYLALDANLDTRLRAYRALFDAAPDHADAPRAHTRQQKAFGNDRFRRSIEALIGRSMEIRSRRRPVAFSGK